MKIGDIGDYYDKNYFYPNYKIYVDQFGVERKYYGPSKDWHGFDYIAKFISDNMPGVKNILDIGCSAGSFVSRAKTFDLNCHGVDVSKFAIYNCLPGAQGRVFLKDIIKSTPTMKYDMCTGFDLMEHLLAKDTQKAIEFIRNSLEPGGRFFACIATARNQNELFEHTSFEDEIPQDKIWLGVSGHVNIKYIHDWIKIFEGQGFTTDYENMMKFQLYRVMNSELSRVDSWGATNVYIGRI